MGAPIAIRELQHKLHPTRYFSVFVFSGEFVVGPAQIDHTSICLVGTPTSPPPLFHPDLISLDTLPPLSLVMQK